MVPAVLSVLQRSITLPLRLAWGSIPPNPRENVCAVYFLQKLFSRLPMKIMNTVFTDHLGVETRSSFQSQCHAIETLAMQPRRAAEEPNSVGAPRGATTPTQVYPVPPPLQTYLVAHLSLCGVNGSSQVDSINGSSQAGSVKGSSQVVSVEGSAYSDRVTRRSWWGGRNRVGISTHSPEANACQHPSGRGELADAEENWSEAQGSQGSYLA